MYVFLTCKQSASSTATAAAAALQNDCSATERPTSCNGFQFRSTDEVDCESRLRLRFQFRICNSLLAVGRLSRVFVVAPRACFASPSPSPSSSSSASGPLAAAAAVGLSVLFRCCIRVLASRVVLPNNK